MTHSSAILFEFNDTGSAALASETLQQLGYETVLHEDNQLHIHMDGNDLTSALEIAQAHGGQLVEQTAITSSSLTDSAYALDAISIPAHIVNEDLIALEEQGEQLAGLRNVDDDADYSDEFLPDLGTYDHFSGDVHI